MAEPKSIEVPSSKYGKYFLRSRLGQGGMAEVFLAEAIDDGQQINVALKLMKKDAPEEMFAAEADLMGMLNHPNLVRALEVGNAFGRPYITMEFLIGGDLKEVMEAHRRQNKPIPMGMGLYVIIELLRGLAYFHTASTRTGAPLNLIHSDINPANVFFSGHGEVKLGDFGVASSSHVDIGPGEGVAAGKLSYLSPEQTRGEKLTPSSDLWAVGVMLHELVVGYHPFQIDGLDEQGTMNAIRNLRLTYPDYVDKPMVAILQKALATDVKNRFKSAGEMAGPIFAYALDRNLLPTWRAVQEWLESVLGLLV